MSEETVEHDAGGPRPSGHRLEMLRSADPATRVAVSGFVTTAVSFGPARSAFGLFVPVFRSEFGLGTTAVGLIAAMGYLGFLVGLVVALVATRRRATVVGGAVAAVAGMTTVATASDAAVLAIGVFAAAVSAGGTWTPFNAITERAVPAERSDSTLAIVSTGTALGLAGTGLVAAVVIAGDLAWRQAWWAFAVVGVLVAAADVLLVPIVGSERTAGGRLRAFRSTVSCPGTPRLLVAGLLVGVGTSIWLAFAVDAVVAAGGGDALAEGVVGPVMFMAAGLCGLVAVGTGRLIRRWSLAITTRIASMAIAGSLILVGAAPSELAGALLSAALFGVGLMVASACLASASLRLYRSRSVEGFTAVLLSMAFGNIAGAAATGAIADHVGLGATLIAIGAVLAATAWTATSTRRAPWQLPPP